MEPFTLVIFGITSNLAQIKLIPTLYDLVAGHYLPSNFQVVGVGRTLMDQSGFQSFVSQTLRTKNRHHTHAIDPSTEQDLFTHLTYLAGDLTDLATYAKLQKILSSHNTPNHMFYLATFPSLYNSIFENLKSSGLADAKHGWTRLLIEKPIGSDASSAKQVNDLLTTYFKEDQIYRLDHYLGKETLQNILTFRFSNGILEPLMDSQHLDHIEVTAAEDFGIGNRGSYYDQNGAIKDVGQNHLLQMIALATMDKPVSMDNVSITKERVKVLKSLVPDPSSLVIGQYDGYLQEKDIAPGSITETYFSFKTMLDNDRYRGIPIYVRGGKYLARTATEISFIFKNSPNILIYRIQPNEGIVLKILTKRPGHSLVLDESYMQYCYPRELDLPDAYEKLIMDALRGDQTFFNDADEVDAQWAFTDTLLQSRHGITPTIYEKGSWGPADDIPWLEPSTAFCNY